MPGILAIRVDAAIYFSNSNYIHDKILHYLEEEMQRLSKSDGAPIKYLIVDLTRKPRTFNYTLLSLILHGAMFSTRVRRIDNK